MKYLTAAIIAMILPAGLSAEEYADFSGVWETTYGTMILNQEGSSVSGYYTLGGYSTVEGEVDSDGKLTFTYQEPSASGQGWFVLSDDGSSLEGMWRPAGSQNWSSWEGTRAGSGAEYGKWLVILESEWQTLSENEYSFGQMLNSWFARVPGVNVRHRFIHDEFDLAYFCIEAAALPGEVYLVIASHGTEGGVQLTSTSISPESFIAAIRPCSNLAMIHFSCCSIMAGGLPADIVNSRQEWPEGFVVSGYTESVDWAASGMLEIYYLNQILENGLSPCDAARSVVEDVQFATSETSWMSNAGFTWVREK